MQASNTEDFQQQVLTKLDRLTVDVEALKQELSLTNVRVDTYQKASTQVVNLAFGLIVTATVTIVASVVLK